MRTQVFKAKGRRLAPEAVKKTVAVLQAGGTVVLPTDTVYGLAASVFRPAAIKKVYSLKGRSYKKRLPFLTDSAERALALVEPPGKNLRRLMADYWPGPLTIVFTTSTLGRWATHGKDTLALRVPDHPVTLAVLKAMDQPLAVTSANRSGKKEATTAAEAKKIFGGRVDVIIDGGACPGGVPSTVVDVSSFAWTLVREGAVPKADILKYT